MKFKDSDFKKGKYALIFENRVDEIFSNWWNRLLEINRTENNKVIGHWTDDPSPNTKENESISLKTDVEKIITKQEIAQRKVEEQI